MKLRAIKGLLFALCCLADLSLLQTIGPETDIADGQFRRGYFEPFGGGVGLVMDNAVRPSMLPAFQGTAQGGLGIPPGMTAVAPLLPDMEYAVVSASARAPYVVIGVEAPVTPVAPDLPLADGEARLSGARTLSLRDGRLALVDWDAAQPWGNDAARLAALRAACGGDGAPLTVSATADALDLRYGDCVLTEARAATAAPPLLATLAGPSWMTVTRRPGWVVHPGIRWLLVAAVVFKVAAIWWSLGLASAVALSAVLAAAALYLPIAATLTWLLGLGLALVAGASKLLWIVALRHLPVRVRLAASAAVLALIAVAIGARAAQPRSFPPIMRPHGDSGGGDACAVLGYSTVKGEGLRHERGAIHWILDQRCEPCRQRTAGLFAGGETLAWARDAYCGSPESFGAGGVVAFLGAANDDLMWGALAIARIVLVGQRGSDAWQTNALNGAAASLARMEEQTAALEGFMDCAQSRGARFLFLHDFLSTDLDAGRDADRASMLARRRATVEAGGGTFIDVLDAFADEVGVAWFNDYVHLSLVAHQRVAALACRHAR